MGLRSILSTISALLPMAQTLVLLGLELGYCSVMLDVARGRGAEARNLSAGFQRFGPMLRATLLQGLIYLAIFIGAAYLSVWIFMLLPVSNTFYELAAPIMESFTTMSVGFTLDNETLFALNGALLPYYVILLVLCCVMIIPIMYQYRMVTFCIADGEQPRALAALRDSIQMMRRNRFALFRLDLSFWWYYLLQALVSVICYGDMLLSMAGIALPWSSGVSTLLFLAMSLLLQLAVFYFFLNRVTVTYATAYDALRPRPQTNSIPLGNIFDM